MTKRLILIVIPMLIISALTLAACNLPFKGEPTQDFNQVQTLAAATVQAQVGQFLTQTAQAPHVIVITATPQATVQGQPTAVPPTATGTALPPTATSIPPTATAIPIPCNQAGWVTDVTIPDGSSFIVSSSFVKTWRVRNTGACTWGSGYSIVFISGDAMSAPASVALPASVKPGQTVDISVPMIAPANTGSYTGNWMLRSPNGTTFGVGPANGTPVTVKIVVNSIPKPKDPNTIYDFVGNYCAAQWRTNGGFINCPSSSVNYTGGSITRTYAPILENGIADDEGTLITVPATGGDGMIQGQFPAIAIHSGDHLVATLLCSNQKPQCSVTFEVLAMENGTSTTTSLGTWEKTYDNSNLPIDLDLSSMDGKKMIFFLKVSSKGNSTDDMAQWMAVRVTHP
jgi:hypothetical protein